MKYETLLKRITKYGYTDEEAMNCPVGKPLWIYRIEQELGEPLKDFLARTAETALETKTTLKALANHWGVGYQTLHYWSRRWGVSFPNPRTRRESDYVPRVTHDGNHLVRSA